MISRRYHLIRLLDSLLICLVCTLTLGCSWPKDYRDSEDGVGLDQTVDLVMNDTRDLMHDHADPPLHLSNWRLVSQNVRDSMTKVDHLRMNTREDSPSPVDVVPHGVSVEEGVRLMKTLALLQKDAGQDSALTLSPSMFPQRSYFCRTAKREVYLAHKDNRSPAFTLSAPLSQGDSFALFMFDLDAPILTTQALSDVWRGPAPSWVNVTSAQRVSKYLIKRAPFLLWSVNDISHQMREIPEGLGGVGLTLKGRSHRTVRIGQAWSNDYSTWFTSQAVSGDYYGYDGPCIPWNDPQSQHRILIVILSLSHPIHHDFASLTSQRSDMSGQSGWRLFQLAIANSTEYAMGVWLTQRISDVIEN